MAAELARGRRGAFAARGVFAGARGFGRYEAVFWRFAVVLNLSQEVASALRFAGGPRWKDSAVDRSLPGRGMLIMLIGAMVKNRELCVEEVYGKYWSR